MGSSSMSDRYHKCNACGFTTPIDEVGVALMREHLKTHSIKEQKDVYVVAMGRRNRSK
jgi:adenine-specific DNA methylase